MEKLVRNRKFIFGLVFFGFLTASYFVFSRFYKPLIVFSDSVSFRFALLEQGTSADNLLLYEYVSFIYDYNRDRNRLKVLPAQGKLFVKRIVCKEGQKLVVNVNTREFFCDGVFLGKAREKFLNGEEAPLFVFSGVIPEGKLFVEGDTKYSFDSRYWGFVDKSEIVGRVIPIF